VSVLGYVRFNVGDIVVNENTSDEIIVTEDNVKNFRKLVRMLIPINSLERNTPNEIYLEMLELNKLQQSMSGEDFANYILNKDSADNVIESEKSALIDNKQHADTEDTKLYNGFNVNKLSTDQFKTLILCKDLISTTKN
jgi:hypothetical protein